MQAATQFNSSRGLEKEYKDNVKGLKEFILQAGVDRMNEKDLLAIVFRNNGEEWRDDGEMTSAFNKEIDNLTWAESSSK